MIRQIGSMCAVALLAGSAVAAEEEHLFRTDNGIYELGFQYLNREALVGNYYTAPAGVTLTIDRVEAAVGFGQAGRGYEVLIYNDPTNDGDPIDAVLVSRTSAVVGPQGPSFNTLYIEDVAVEPAEVSGGFFVALWLNDQPFAGLHGDNSGWRTAPLAYRTHHHPTATNWLISPPFSNMGTGDIDTEDLSQNLLVRRVEFNWVIRAFGATTPAEAMSADMNSDGSFDFIDIMMFLNAFGSGEADFNGDRTTDALDVIAFLQSWQVGTP